MSAMSKQDRLQLAQVAKMRARVAKASIDSREHALNSQVENELKTMFDAEDSKLEQAMKIAAECAAAANRELAERLDLYDVPARLRPRIGYSDPEKRFDADSKAMRRANLRRIAASRIRALAANARVEIDRSCADTVEQLIAGGLSGEEAQTFLSRMPTIDGLMMAPSVAELEAVHDEQRRENRALGEGL